MSRSSCRDKVDTSWQQTQNRRRYRHMPTARVWALIITVGAHIIILTALGFVEFSHFKTDRNPAGPLGAGKPTASLKPVPARTALIVPKPGIRKPGSAISVDTLKLSTNEIFANFKPAASIPPVELYRQGAAGDTVNMSTEGLQLTSGVEFFGTFARQRRVCYVVDCSGSMQGLFGLVQNRLCESVKKLQADQYFEIIFFAGDRLDEFGDARLVRATNEAKIRAYRFIETARPAGKTNAMAALETALHVRDSTGQGAEVIYFLTDGFELGTGGTYMFQTKTANLLAQFAPKTKINTIGFYAQSRDCGLLETIAEQSGGQFVLVTDGHKNPPKDILED